MYCPKCGCEYREGFNQCTECDVALVAEPPAVKSKKMEWPDMVILRTISDSAFLLVAKSILLDAGIPFWIKNEGLQDLIGFGRVGMGFNIMIQPVGLFIPKKYMKEANRLLDDVKNAGKS